MTDPEIHVLADRLHVNLHDVELAILLMRSGRVDLIAAVVDRKLTVAMAIRALQTGNHQKGATS